MYIPTQEERYSKAALLTLLLCVIVPSGIILYLKGITDLLLLAFGFTLPLAYTAQEIAGLGHIAATAFSFVFQTLLFYFLVIRSKRPPKTKITIAITWGMFLALCVKAIIPHIGG